MMFTFTLPVLLTAAQEDIKASQKDLEAGLINIIASREHHPVPGRALRNLVTNCFLILYTRGDSKNMFDTLIAFLKVASDFKAPADRDQHKMSVPLLYFLTAAIDLCVPEPHYTALAS